MPTPSILTLTGNLLAERTQEFADWAEGRTQRARAESFQVGGKGINVSKMLHRLGAPTTALCFVGGAPGAECAGWLKARDFATHAIATGGSTRVGLVVRATGRAETTFLGPDVPPDAAAIAACVAWLAEQPDGQVLAICGSLPGWTASHFEPMRSALAAWLGRGRLAVDSYGPPLAWFATQPVDLVKINAAELRTLFPGSAADTPTSRLLAEAATRWPVRRWIVTDGPAPAWHCAHQGRPEAVVPPKVTEVSATGSGDVLFACVLDRLFRRGDGLGAALTAALPYAAANAAHPGIAEFPEP
ncbi:MAG: hypothetical protein JSR48_03990 [Verrucomicrobia bacterium]|nr:hypothetical protein [Verrucomicrobiota bacterium]